jgi:hypothetical protein
MSTTAGGSAKRTTVVLGTATPGGGFPVYGAAVADTVHETEPTLEIEQRNTKGSTENVPLLESGQVDIALVQGEVAHEAFTGIGRPPANLKIVAAMYSTPGMFVVRGDSPYRRVEDLRGKSVVFGARGSGLVILSRYVLDGLALDQERDFQAVYLDRAGDGPAMLLDGRAAALWGGGIGWPNFVALANAPGGARFIAPAPEDVRRVQAKHSFIRTIAVPAGSYPGQDAPIAAPGSWSLVLASPRLADDVAYRLARALHRGRGAIAARHPQGHESTLQNTLAAAATHDLVHPGVLRYMREAGILR